MKSNSRSGMTLVEVTAATALAVLMIAAMSGVLRSLRVQKSALVADELQPAWQRQLVNDIRWDLTNSHDMAVQPGQLKILGFSGRDPHSREVTHRLTEVSYTVRELNGKHLLLRHETSLDSRSVELGNVESKNQECIAVGITGIFLTSMEETVEQDVVSKLINKNTVSQKPDQWVPIPHQFRLVLTGESHEPIIDEIIAL